MLQSKYLTEDGVEKILSNLYKDGARYLYRPTGYSRIYLSQNKPEMHDDGGITSPTGDAHALQYEVSILLSDIFENTNYINIWWALNKVDWSKVPVDTKVYAYYGDKVQQRHFACYKDGKVHTWIHGCTSWSTKHTNGDWDRVELAEEVKYD